MFLSSQVKQKWLWEKLNLLGGWYIGNDNLWLTFLLRGLSGNCGVLTLSTISLEEIHCDLNSLLVTVSFVGADFLKRKPFTGEWNIVAPTIIDIKASILTPSPCLILWSIFPFKIRAMVNRLRLKNSKSKKVFYFG